MTGFLQSAGVWVEARSCAAPPRSRAGRAGGTRPLVPVPVDAPQPTPMPAVGLRTSPPVHPRRSPQRISHSAPISPFVEDLDALLAWEFRGASSRGRAGPRRGFTADSLHPAPPSPPSPMPAADAARAPAVPRSRGSARHGEPWEFRSIVAWLGSNVSGARPVAGGRAAASPSPRQPVAGDLRGEITPALSGTSARPRPASGRGRAAGEPAGPPGAPAIGWGALLAAPARHPVPAPRPAFAAALAEPVERVWWAAALSSCVAAPPPPPPDRGRAAGEVRADQVLGFDHAPGRRPPPSTFVRVGWGTTPGHATNDAIAAPHVGAEQAVLDRMRGWMGGDSVRQLPTPRRGREVTFGVSVLLVAPHPPLLSQGANAAAPARPRRPGRQSHSQPGPLEAGLVLYVGSAPGSAVAGSVYFAGAAAGTLVGE